ncbi:hypothetical protein AMATHDRAFT_2296 [Amanita thiersii Skay4041]|uniref:F-box domain-containing protein n=1 Tax=Amanita thiersii Skay4041 TaxID=703135 RepID=A0A2A9NX18_9AGAR|nr:hypothetical protein AMATHDRAFT_2296 [Amanita thiersii Skay4041]
MTNIHDITTDDSLFQFDPYDLPSNTSLGYSNLPDLQVPIFPRHHISSSEELDDQQPHLSDWGNKGKAVTRPLPIPPRSSGVTNDFSASSSGSAAALTSHGSFLSSPSSLLSTSSSPLISDHPTSPQETDFNPLSEFWGLHSTFGQGKGKQRDVTHSAASHDIDLAGHEHQYHEHSLWPAPRSPTPGPSNSCSPSYLFMPLESATHGLELGVLTSPESTATTDTSPRGLEDHLTLKRMPSRRRSLSNLSFYSSRSLASQSMLKVKVKLNMPRIQNNLASSLLFRKKAPVKEQQGESPRIDSIVSDIDPALLQYPDFHFSGVQPNETHFSSPDHPLLKSKGRSKSLPAPISALDYVPVSSLDVFEPIPLIIKNYFDDDLPRELRLRVFKCLIDLHETDFQRLITSGKWSMAKASSSRCEWVGRARGVRELFKLSRVSKTWQKLVFDGQLWNDIDLHLYSGISESALQLLSQTSSSFARSLNLAGHVQLHPSILIDIADNLSTMYTLSSQALVSTQLASVNLQGCSSLTTRSLHHLLMQSNLLESLNVKGLAAVTNMTCDILATYCPSITHINMSRCPNMDADGIQRLANAALGRGEYLRLKSLRISGLRNVNERMMSILGNAAPYLEVLDLSYSRQLHDSAIEAFVSCTANESLMGTEVITLTAREVGHSGGDKDCFHRRVTNLRHISLSYCVLLSDMTCSNLAYSVPRLQFLEMAGIGSDLKDDGLVRLFRTTPHIRRIDLEDASDITDAVISTITPNSDPEIQQNVNSAEADLQPGYALEHLIMSHASQISDEALLTMIRNCSQLTCLEADNTRMSAAVLREFVKLSRERKISNAKIVAVDCRGIGDPLVKELSDNIRPRMGWRSYAARKLMYLDARDDNAEELKVGQDECDEKRVVVKSFYSWQTVDAVRSAREKRRRATRRIASDGSDYEDFSWRTRWWSPGGRRLGGSGRDTPHNLTDVNNDGCITM